MQDTSIFFPQIGNSGGSQPLWAFFVTEGPFPNFSEHCLAKAVNSIRFRNALHDLRAGLSRILAVLSYGGQSGCFLSGTAPPGENRVQENRIEKKGEKHAGKNSRIGFRRAV